MNPLLNSQPHPRPPLKPPTPRQLARLLRRLTWIQQLTGSLAVSSLERLRKGQPVPAPRLWNPPHGWNGAAGGTGAPPSPDPVPIINQKLPNGFQWGQWALAPALHYGLKLTAWVLRLRLRRQRLRLTGKRRWPWSTAWWGCWTSLDKPWLNGWRALRRGTKLLFGKRGSGDP